MAGRVLSVNVGVARPLAWKGTTTVTAFIKRPVNGAVAVSRGGVAGDEQADPEVHGAPRKAVYAYPSEHYPFWKGELPGVDLPPGSFGENLTIDGFSERTTHIGDRLRVGTALLEVTQPRLPCRKLNVRFQRDDMLRRFGESLRTGFYLTVLEEGILERGCEIHRLSPTGGGPSVEEVARGRLRPDPSLSVAGSGSE
ncbi:MAG: MOSC domain-containing protein [Thermoplasmata archaeon]|nr:MOSC domain-containing protein [Thermoplasmata archaeon]